MPGLAHDVGLEPELALAPVPAPMFAVVIVLIPVLATAMPDHVPLEIVPTTGTYASVRPPSTRADRAGRVRRRQTP